MNGSNARTLAETALCFKLRGWEPVFVPNRSKNPGRLGWPNERLSEDEICAKFARGGNIGLLTGEPSGGLIDVDIDAREAKACAPVLLPPTRMIHGRLSSPRSHYWYISSPDLRTTCWKDLRGKSIIELRATGTQTIVPPSHHPSGELLTWEVEREPARICAEQLVSAVTLVAVTSLIARHLPSKKIAGDACAALVRFLVHRGLESANATRVIATAARLAGSSQGQDCPDCSHHTGPFRAPEIATTLSHGETVVARLSEWLATLKPSRVSALLSGDRPPGNGRNSRRDPPTWVRLVFDAVCDHLAASGHRLRQSGNGGVITTCPLHPDRNPSLSLHPARGWKCFAGCGAGRITILAHRLGVSA